MRLDHLLSKEHSGAGVAGTQTHRWSSARLGAVVLNRETSTSGQLVARTRSVLPASPEWNLRCDVALARHVVGS